MSNFKRLIKICFILSFVFLGIDTLSFIIDIVGDISTLSFILDTMSISSLICASIVFGIFNFNNEEFARKNKALLIIFSCVAFIGSIIIGVLGLVSLNYLNPRVVAVEKTDNSLNAQNEEAKEDVAREEEKSEPKVKESTRPSAEELIKKIQELDKMKAEGEISSEEYEELKEKILEEIVK